jgi:thymidylate synthase
MNYKTLTIEATTLVDAWFQTIYACVEQGRDFEVDRGSFEGETRLEFDYFTVNIKNPGIQPLLPEIPAQYGLPNPVPGGRNSVDDYAMNYLLGCDVKDGESYTYGQRLTKYPLTPIPCGSMTFAEGLSIPEVTFGDFATLPFIIKEAHNEDFGLYNYYLDQVKLVIETYKNKGYRNNQMVLQVAQPSDGLLKDPPCLRQIDTRIQDNKLHFIVYFRSWDLWAGFPANLAAIQLMKEYMAAEIGVEDGSMVASSKGLHLYNYVWQLAETIRGKSITEFQSGR